MFHAMDRAVTLQKLSTHRLRSTSSLIGQPGLTTMGVICVYRVRLRDGGLHYASAAVTLPSHHPVSFRPMALG